MLGPGGSPGGAWLQRWCLPALLAGHARAEPAEGPSLEEIKTTLDQVEEAVGRDDVTQEALVELRQKLNAATDTLRDKIDDLEPRVREAEERLKQLGPAPAKDAPPESRRSPTSVRSSRRASASSTAR